MLQAAASAFPAAISGDLAALAGQEGLAELAEQPSPAFQGLVVVQPGQVVVFQVSAGPHRAVEAPRGDLAVLLGAAAARAGPVLVEVEAEAEVVEAPGGVALKLVRDVAACSRCLAWRDWRASVRTGFASA
jgi:hypothetical protein